MSTTKITSNPAKGTAAIEELQKLLQRLSPEERDQMAQAGVTVPTGDITAIIKREYKWGLLCRQCGNLALFFLGDSWEVDGITYDQPPALPHNRIAWTQHLPPSDIDRHEPRCQCCGVPVTVNSGGGFEYANKRLVRLADWDQSRDVRYNRAEAQRVNTAASKGTGAVQGAGDTDFRLRDTPASATMDKQRGEGFSQQLEQFAEQSGAADFARGNFNA